MLREKTTAAVAQSGAPGAAAEDAGGLGILGTPGALGYRHLHLAQVKSAAGCPPGFRRKRNIKSIRFAERRSRIDFCLTLPRAYTEQLHTLYTTRGLLYLTMERFSYQTGRCRSWGAWFG